MLKTFSQRPGGVPHPTRAAAPFGWVATERGLRRRAPSPDQGPSVRMRRGLRGGPSDVERRNHAVRPRYCPRSVNRFSHTSSMPRSDDGVDALAGSNDQPGQCKCAPIGELAAVRQSLAEDHSPYHSASEPRVLALPSGEPGDLFRHVRFVELPYECNQSQRYEQLQRRTEPEQIGFHARPIKKSVGHGPWSIDSSSLHGLADHKNRAGLVDITVVFLLVGADKCTGERKA